LSWKIDGHLFIAAAAAAAPCVPKHEVTKENWSGLSYFFCPKTFTDLQTAEHSYEGGYLAVSKLMNLHIMTYPQYIYRSAFGCNS
jgi:hypothetical protein